MLTPASSTVTFFITMLVHIVCRISGFSTHCGTISTGAVTSTPSVIPPEMFVTLEVLVTEILDVSAPIVLALSVTASVSAVTVFIIEVILSLIGGCFVIFSTSSVMSAVSSVALGSSLRDWLVVDKVSLVVIFLLLAVLDNVDVVGELEPLINVVEVLLYESDKAVVVKVVFVESWVDMEGLTVYLLGVDASNFVGVLLEL